MKRRNGAIFLLFFSSSSLAVTGMPSTGGDERQDRHRRMDRHVRGARLSRDLFMYSTEAYFKYINDQGGINGRKLEYIAYNDDYEPPNRLPLRKNYSKRTKSSCS